MNSYGKKYSIKYWMTGLVKNTMDIEKLIETINNLEKILTPRQKKYVHFLSFRNFVFHYSKLSGKRKQEVLDILNEYFVLITESNYFFEKDDSYDLANHYLNRLADYYTDIGFVLNIKFAFVIYWGLLFDLLFFLSSKVMNFKFFPIVTTLCLMYYLYISIFKKRKKLVYGVFY